MIADNAIKYGNYRGPVPDSYGPPLPAGPLAGARGEGHKGTGLSGGSLRLCFTLTKRYLGLTKTPPFVFKIKGWGVYYKNSEPYESAHGPK
jgi:hypothetical protein